MSLSRSVPDGVDESSGLAKPALAHQPPRTLWDGGVQQQEHQVQRHREHPQPVPVTQQPG